MSTDIGELLSKGKDLKKLSQEHRYQILTAEPNLNPSSYPRTHCLVSNRMRQFHPTWFKQFRWLHYSAATDGSFCRACALFAPESVGGHPLGQFVSLPFRTWRKMSEKANAHGKLDYHLESLAKMSEFLPRYENPSHAVDTLW